MMTRSQVQPTAKAAIEQHPLFANGRVPVLLSQLAPGEPAQDSQTLLRQKGALIEVSPILRQKVVTSTEKTLVSECTISVAVRVLPITPAQPAGEPAALMLTMDTAVDAVCLAMLNAGGVASDPKGGFKPETELAQLVEDMPGTLSTAVFFTVRTHLANS